MNWQAEILLYQRGDDKPVLTTLVTRLGAQTAKVKKKLDLYARMTVQQLFHTGILDPIEGTGNLYELKVKCLPTPVRFVCALQGHTCILLDVFFTSGSGNKVMRHVEVSRNRFREWQSRQDYNRT